MVVEIFFFIIRVFEGNFLLLFPLHSHSFQPPLNSKFNFRRKKITLATKLNHVIPNESLKMKNSVSVAS